ncbi:MAG: diguanylate cyclase [Rhodospirillaceae bacterium]|nr:diguanylate cyclase [Rhodospirillaceae bacterium]
MPADQGHAIPGSRALPTRESNTVFARFPEAVLQFGGDGTITACNSAADTLLRQLEGSIDCLSHLRALADDAQSTRAAASNTIEWTFGGQTRHMLASAMPADDAAAFIICRDTTVETTMRLALIDSRQRFKDLVEISSDFAWETDLTGSFTFVSTTGVLDHPAGALIGRSARDLLFHPDAVPGDQIFEAQEIVDARELWLRRADGEAVCGLASARPILDKNGSRRGTRGVCRDVTADRLRENDLARMITREQVIAYIVDAVRNEADPLDMLSTAATSIGKAMSDTACAVFQREETGELSLIARFGALPDETGLAQSVASLCTDVTAHETHVDGEHQLMTATHYRGDMNGAILLSRKRQSSWSAHDRSLLDAVAGQLGIALRQIENQRALERLSRTDALTGLFNRRAYLEELDRALDRAQRNGQSGAVFFVDLNNFKSVNDVHGHDVGDKVLGELAALLMRTTRSYDFVARLGGDEFALWFENIDKTSARRRARELLRHCRHLDAYSGTPSKPLGLSIGIAMFQPNSEESSDRLLKRADAAMYRAKHSRKHHLSLARDIEP